jgi:hypothetical protein
MFQFIIVQQTKSDFYDIQGYLEYNWKQNMFTCFEGIK